MLYFSTCIGLFIYFHPIFSRFLMQILICDVVGKIIYGYVSMYHQITLGKQNLKDYQYFSASNLVPHLNSF